MIFCYVFHFFSDLYFVNYVLKFEYYNLLEGTWVSFYVYINFFDALVIALAPVVFLLGSLLILISIDYDLTHLFLIFFSFGLYCLFFMIGMGMNDAHADTIFFPIEGIMRFWFYFFFLPLLADMIIRLICSDGLSFDTSDAGGKACWGGVCLLFSIPSL